MKFTSNTRNEVYSSTPSIVPDISHESLALPDSNYEVTLLLTLIGFALAYHRPDGCDSVMPVVPVRKTLRSAEFNATILFIYERRLKFLHFVAEAIYSLTHIVILYLSSGRHHSIFMLFSIIHIFLLLELNNHTLNGLKVARNNHITSIKEKHRITSSLDSLQCVRQRFIGSGTQVREQAHYR